MSRCVVIHPNGSTQVQDFHPAEHQRLRGLGYRRFALQFLRGGDKQMVNGAVYSRVTPSAWQASEATRQLWGRGAGAIRLFDENGELVEHRSDPLNTAITTPAPVTSSEPAHSAAVPESSPSTAGARMHAMDAIVTEHRLRALAHHWVYLVDRNDGDGAAFADLFAPRFELQWQPRVMRTLAEFSAWYLGLSRRLLRSSHTIASFHYQAISAGRYRVELELQWCGFTRAHPDAEFEATTLHEWTVADDPSDRFARIEIATIRTLVPARLRLA
jgi:SnoaL-like domain